jgi:glutaredoxin
MTSFLNWWRKAPPLDHLRFTFYTRAGCHLCDDARALLEPYRQRHGFALEVVDVDTDPELVAQHGNCVPVISVDGKVRFRGRVNRVLLERFLQAEAGKRGS